MRRLAILTGIAKGAAYELNGGPVLIGRNDDAAIVFADTEVSRRHAELIPDGDEFTLRDFGSANGTFLNGQPITEGRLKPGDRVMFGTVETRYEEVRQPVPAAPGLVPRFQELEEQNQTLRREHEASQRQLAALRQETERRAHETQRLLKQERDNSRERVERLQAELQRVQARLGAASDRADESPTDLAASPPAPIPLSKLLVAIGASHRQLPSPGSSVTIPAPGSRRKEDRHPRRQRRSAKRDRPRRFPSLVGIALIIGVSAVVIALVSHWHAR